MLIAGQALTPGRAAGPLLLLSEPLSLWGGLDLRTGAIIDRTHPQCGVVIAGRIVAMRSARGSSSSSSALVEAARAGVAPAALILGLHDPILTIGALVAADLYGIEIPLIVVDEGAWPALVDGVALLIETEGNQARITVDPV
ncbi:MAG: aconitase X swivel domain-containing protein [Sphingobium sp.]